MSQMEPIVPNVPAEVQGCQQARGSWKIGRDRDQSLDEQPMIALPSAMKRAPCS